MKPLPPPIDVEGNTLYFGSIIDFDKIPVQYHSKSMNSRGIKAPTKVGDIRALCKMIWNSHGTRLQPIQKILMRGVSGWIKEEVITVANPGVGTEWSRKDDLLCALHKSFPKINDDVFIH